MNNLKLLNGFWLAPPNKDIDKIGRLATLGARELSYVNLEVASSNPALVNLSFFQPQLWVRSFSFPGSTLVCLPVRSNSFDVIPGAHPGQLPVPLPREGSCQGLTRVSTEGRPREANRTHPTLKICPVRFPCGLILIILIVVLFMLFVNSLVLTSLMLKPCRKTTVDCKHPYKRKRWTIWKV